MAKSSRTVLLNYILVFIILVATATLFVYVLRQLPFKHEGGLFAIEALLKKMGTHNDNLARTV